MSIRKLENKLQIKKSKRYFQIQQSHQIQTNARGLTKAISKCLIEH